MNKKCSIVKVHNNLDVLSEMYGVVKNLDIGIILSRNLMLASLSIL
jgi:hypothetical protein